MAIDAFRSMRANVRSRWAALPIALLLLAGCSSAASEDAAGADVPGPMSSGGGTSANIGAGVPTVGSGGASSLPPEKELDQTFRAPVATGSVLWSANPDSGRVALIDARTLQVRMTNAGFGPTYLAAVPGAPGTDSAI